jgi:uncharacterized protein (TIGR03435 family)
MTRRSAPFVLVVSLLTATAGLVKAGPRVPAAPDVLSVVKPNRSGGVNGMLGVPFDGKFEATNVTVLDLIAAAYGTVVPLDAGHISGLPPWATSERYDVQAKADDAPPTEDSEDDRAIVAAFAMVRSLLADRFGLRTHDIHRQEPIYALVRAKGGVKAALQKTRRDCDAIAAAGPFSSAPAGVDPAMWVPCGVRARRGQIIAAGGTMALLARQLAPVNGINRDVVDRTALAGRFDFTLQWTPPQSVQNDGSGTAAATDVGPSIFTALQEQLGLKLESARGPVRVLVIEHVDHPTPN